MIDDHAFELPDIDIASNCKRCGKLQEDHASGQPTAEELAEQADYTLFPDLSSHLPPKSAEPHMSDNRNDGWQDADAWLRDRAEQDERRTLLELLRPTPSPSAPRHMPNGSRIRMTQLNYEGRNV